MPRTIRPMITIDGTVSELREHDYIDTIGGGHYRRERVAALVHTVEHVDFDFDTVKAQRLVDAGLPGHIAANSATTEPHATITLLGSSEPLCLRPEAPVTFRRFTDTDTSV